MGRIHGQSKRNDQVIYESMILTGIWQLGKAWKSERLVVMNVDCIIHSIGSFIFKVAQGSKCEQPYYFVWDYLAFSNESTKS